MRMPRARAIGIAAAAGVVVALVVGLLGRPAAAPPHIPAQAVLVTRVYDGDTIGVAGVGKVRLIGVDTMDAHDRAKAARQARDYGLAPRKVEYWAERAAEFARGELRGRRVVLHAGPEAVGDFGRALAYVHLPAGDGAAEADFNLMLIQAGLAAAYRRFEHPRREAYLRAEARARAGRLGLWQDAGIRN